VQAILAKIDEIDPKWEIFKRSPNRRRILYLLNPTSPRASELTSDPLDASQSDFIGKNAFFMDHPNYVACYVDRDRLYLIGTENVVIHCPGQEQETIDYELALPLDTTATVHEVLSKKTQIQKFMRNGYRPVVRDAQVTLVPGGDVDALETFRCRIEHLHQELIEGGGLGRKALDLSLCFQQFLEYMGKSPALAQDTLKQAADCKLPEDLQSFQTVVAELYADFLYIRQKMPQAAAAYRNLARADQDRKRFFLERVFMCTPASPQIDEELTHVEAEDARQHFRHLFGYLQCLGTDRAQDFFRRTSKQDPFINLAALNAISRAQKDLRIEIFKRLSRISGHSAYYRTCVQVENTTTIASDEAIIRLIESEDNLKGQRKIALKMIDTLIEGNAFELAARVVSVVIETLKKHSSKEWLDKNKISQLRFEGDGGAFGRRELVLCDAMNKATQMKTVASRLMFSIYQPAKNYQKAFAIAEVSFKKCGTFERSCVSTLLKQDKVKEAACTAVDIAFTLLCRKENARARAMLEEVRNLDPDLTRFFSKEEQFMITLMEKMRQVE